ncbi:MULTISPECIES: acyltransferase family protein [Olivibacter]|uniref:Acyltransferase family protein n=1 Tax=Olivibacter oleidegradans TaxID=760123 RepID=A0ABV6HEJ9_9SPHI|nr:MULTISPECIES: acyltransferase family protein [Olivibacter]MDM8177355.1 acyltransferase family protein [Olivibacter sp. 47]QEK99802.1 acyltransferase family protein [Olivibacter sp. LS-1]
MPVLDRRYDIDWMRVIAIALLLIYHIAIGFQPWGMMIGFITNEKSWDALWIPMSMMNIWRIPLLFYVSGMGVYFAMRNRSWKQLFLERAKRILLPFLFGMLSIVPLHLYIWQRYYHFDTAYLPGPGHLWFLGNLFVYVIMFAPIFFYLKRQEHSRLVNSMKKTFSSPQGILLVMSVFIAEVLLIDPMPFELYAMTWHGFVLGMLAFFFGFCFVLCGATFWHMILRWRWLFLAFAVTFFIIRITYFQSSAPTYMLSIESNCWIISFFAFAYKYFNYPSSILCYLSRAAYPFYILHMIFLYLGSYFIFPLDIDVRIQFVLVLLATITACFLTYEFLIRRIPFIRLLFGLK